MSYKKYRWSKDYEAAEEELEILLNSSAKSSVRCDVTAHQEFIEGQGDKNLKIWCAEGSMTVMVGGAKLSLQPGDTLETTAESTITAMSGISGCVYYKALA